MPEKYQKSCHWFCWQINDQIIDNFTANKLQTRAYEKKNKKFGLSFKKIVQSEK